MGSPFRRYSGITSGIQAEHKQGWNISKTSLKIFKIMAYIHVGRKFYKPFKLDLKYVRIRRKALFFKWQALTIAYSRVPTFSCYGKI